MDVLSPRSLDEALRLLAQSPEALPIAGGTDLMVDLNFDRRRPEALLNLNEVPELAGWSRENGTVRLGAGLTYAEAMQGDVAGLLPALAEASRTVGSPQIRNRGTIGGNLSHADPASELPAIAVAMEARMRIKSSAGERQMAASEFFVGLLSTDIQPDEMLVEIAFPSPKPRSGACFMEVARRRGDFALAGFAAMVTLDEAQRCTNLRLALCGVGETAVDASHAGFSLIGQPCIPEAIEAVATGVREAIAPSGNVHASPDYQRHIAGVLAMRAIGTAYQRAIHAA